METESDTSLTVALALQMSFCTTETPSFHSTTDHLETSNGTILFRIAHLLSLSGNEHGVTYSDSDYPGGPTSLRHAIRVARLQAEQIMRVLIGCEQFGHIREAMRRRGYDAWSCDIEPARDGSPYHIHGDVLAVLGDGWDLGIFHPDCTYLTCSAEWAYKDPDFERYPGVGYHQKVTADTLTGAARREAREQAIAFVLKLRDAPIRFKAIENPVGVLSRHWRKADQTVQPYWFGDDASKATCWWLEGGLPPLVPTEMIAPRMVGGMQRWGNQTDSGQNKLPPSDDRAMLRAQTYPGHAEAIADQWGGFVARNLAGTPAIDTIQFAMPFMARAEETSTASLSQE